MFGLAAASAAGLGIYLALPTSSESTARLSPVVGPGIAGVNLQTSF